MRSRRFFKCVGAIALVVQGFAAGAADNLPMPCAGPACAKVATPTAWPDARPDDGATPWRVLGAVTIRLPQDPREFILHGEGGITARYTQGRWIGVQVMRPPGGDSTRPTNAGNPPPGALNYADLPRILYTHTPTDREPAGSEDLRMWRLALVHKNSIFERATQLHVAERGPLVAYFADAGVAGTTGDVQVVHRQVKDAYLLVQFQGFSFDDVRRVVGSIAASKE